MYRGYWHGRRKWRTCLWFCVPLSTTDAIFLFRLIIMILFKFLFFAKIMWWFSWLLLSMMILLYTYKYYNHNIMLSHPVFFYYFWRTFAWIYNVILWKSNLNIYENIYNKFLKLFYKSLSKSICYKYSS